MRNSVQRHAIVLAALLQVLPIVRNFFINPAATSSFAFILRWGVGTAATVGAYDACSGGTIPYFNPMQTNINLVVGTYYTNNLNPVLVTNIGGDARAYFDLFITNTATDSGQITNKQTTTVALPAGLTAKVFDNAGNSGYLYLAIYGTPTTVAPTYKMTVDAGYPQNGDVYTNLYFTVTASASSPPTITNNPASLTNLVGTNATFSVTVGGAAPLKYQWYFNTNTALLNMTNTSLTLTNIQLTNAGYYRCTITNSVGTTNSANALLTVWQPPIITNHPANLTVLVTSNATFSITAGGTPALAYQWFYNTNTALPNATGTSLTLTNVQLTNAGYYLVRATNSAGTTNSFSALLTVWQPPIITNQPVNFTNVAGGNASFTVVAGGVPALSYQWQLNPNTPQAGATGATFHLSNLRASQSGNYSVVITNSAGSVTSSPATLVVTNPIPPLVATTAIVGGQFQFTFNGIPGLTNTVLTNGNLAGGSWGVFTNLPPPVNNNPIMVGSPAGQPNLFYRLQVVP